jgi:hypothetical protein
MDAGIADTLNRRVAWRIANHLDLVDWFCGVMPGSKAAWCYSPTAATLMGENNVRNSDRAWLVGALAEKTPGVDFDGIPADCDWDNLFAHFRSEILSRRDPQTHPVQAQPLCEMV